MLKRMMTAKVRDQKGEISIEITPDLAPNVWIEATVVHAVQEGRPQLYPFASF